MRRVRAWLMRLMGTPGSPRRDRELDDELESHLQLHIDDNIRAGMSPAEARRQAILALGGLEQTKERWRDQRGFPLIEQLFQDLRYAARLLGGSPGVTVAAVLTLALGIGATAAVFTVLHGVLLRPLPVPADEELVAVFRTVPRPELWREPVSGPRYEAWRRRAEVFAGMSAATTLSLNVMLGGAAERVEGELVSANFFDVLGLRARHGRVFTAADAKGPGEGVPCVISEGLWQRHFSSDPRVLGRTIDNAGTVLTIVGVVPDAFARWRAGVASAPGDIAIWVPYSLAPGLLAPAILNADGYRLLRVMARLRPGVTVQQAGEQMASLDAQVDEVLGGPEPERAVAVIGARALVVDTLTRRSLWLVALTALLVLALASANVAVQLLAQSVARRRELAIRAALGATWVRLVRQMTVESALLAVIGGGIGMLVASWTVPLLMAVAPPAVARGAEVSIDGMTWGFAVIAVMVVTVAIGILPALRTRRGEASNGLRGASGATDRPESLRAQALLVMGQMSVVMPLAAATVLLVASFARLQAVDIGLAEPERLLTMRIDVPAHWRHTPDAVQAFQNRTVARMLALPGVTTVALSDSPPVDYLQPQVRDAGVSITVEGGGRFLNGVAEQAPFTPTRRRVTADYFAALGLPLVTGRAFSPGDHAGAGRVAVINETMARLHWPGQEALGKRVNFENVRPGRPLPEPWTEIVGIVADARQHRYDAPPRPEIYTPLAQVAMPPPSWTLLVRAAIPPAALAPAIRRGIQEDDPSAAVYDVQTMTSIIDAATATPRYATTLVSLFAALALVLVAVGIHGVAAFTAVQRVREIGIRLALGGTRASIMRLVLAQTLRPAAAGMLVGAVTTVLTTRLIGSMLHETSPLDPLLLGIAVAALLVIAIAASVPPARRATRVDPMVALRAE